MLRAHTISPMLARAGDRVPGKGWTYEPKYDGVRVLAFATPTAVQLVTRNHKDKATQFPEIVDALQTIAQRMRHGYVVDGEIVALVRNRPARFQALQDRMHVQNREAIERYRVSRPAVLILFDMLVDGDDVMLDLPWTERRARLERRFGTDGTTPVRVAESIRDGGARMLRKARAAQWEGIMAKRVDAPYRLGMRSASWLKLKVEGRQELVIGGYTEPRKSREYLGALLLGYYDKDRFVYAGHTGGGFTRQALKEMSGRLAPLERKTSPFDPVPHTNAPAHWVTPSVVVEVKFNEWTADGRLRQPIFMGVRDDKDPREVVREDVVHVHRK
jgi:bifunctional non-homologous end joining protein LigD